MNHARIRQTSDQEYGQIYVPIVNWTMMLGTVALTFGFGSSARLAGAYGAAVSTTMLLTTALLYHAMCHIWRWRKPVAVLVSGAFLAVDLMFFVANALKFFDGGWIPLLLGASIFLVMTTWRRGIDAVRQVADRGRETPLKFLDRLQSQKIARVPGTAVFLTRHDAIIPSVLTRHIDEMKALQQDVISLTVQFEQTPRIPEHRRVEIVPIDNAFWHVTVHFGFIEAPSLRLALAQAKASGCPVVLKDAIYFAAHDDVVAADKTAQLSKWRRFLFAFMYRNAVRATDRFDIPADRFVEVGRQIPI